MVRKTKNTLLITAILLIIAVNASFVLADSCTYNGSGTWTINSEDNCSINVSETVPELVITGASGTVTFNETVFTNSLRIEPTDFNGDFTVQTNKIQVVPPTPEPVFWSTGTSSGFTGDSQGFASKDFVSFTNQSDANRATDIRLRVDGGIVATCPTFLVNSIVDCDVSGTSGALWNLIVDRTGTSSGLWTQVLVTADFPASQSGNVVVEISDDGLAWQQHTSAYAYTSGGGK